MEERYKICPECGAEYFSHIDMCKACEVALIYPEEREEIPQAEGTLICLEQGEQEKLADFAKILDASGIEAKVLKLDGKSCSGGGFGIFIDQAHIEAALKALEEAVYKLYPELKVAEDRLNSGLCPACGADLKGSRDECPDCGLNLNGGGGHDHDCGSCGH